MKKTYKIVIIVTTVLVLAGTLFMIFNKKKSSLYVLSIPYEFYLDGNNDISVSIPLYLNENNSDYMNRTNISKSYILDNETNDIYQINLNNINNEDEGYTYLNEDYYLYELNCSFPFSVKEDLVIKDTYLKLKYSNGEELNVRIGSVYIYYENQLLENDNILSCSSMKGISKSIQDKIMLNGVIIKLNPNKYNVKITSIESISINSKINTNEVKLINNIEEDSYYYQTEYKQIINSENNQNNDLNILLNSESYLLIPLLYEEYIESPIIGFKINYSVDNKESTLVVKPFQYYSYSLASMKPELLKVSY